MKISELHEQLFSILCIVDDICRKENVRYFLDSGSAIGAVRDSLYPDVVLFDQYLAASPWKRLSDQNGQPSVFLPGRAGAVSAAAQG